MLSRGTGSMEVLGHELAARLPVGRLDSDRYRRAAEEFNPTLGQRFSAALRDVGFVHALRRLSGLVHFPHHHFARYGPLADRIDRLLCDRSIRDRLRRGGAAYVRRFDWDRSARATLELYRSLT